ncbi:hypothetical protein [Aureibaculum luteum]|uniref:hypothetical protein n=1 Tax=Aureibaculum luteum TaxID=1548456 RepID=UPI000E4C49FD|nr:hypothetical protein [Aureibaculum luteum]
MDTTFSTFLHLIENKPHVRNKTVLIGLFCILIFSCNSDDKSTIDDNCNFISEIILEDDFNGINTSNYKITDVELKNDCLEITFGSSGCGPDLWEENLYSVDAFYTVFPLQRALKMKLINEELCLTVFQKTVSFDITPIQIDGQSELQLNIYGWNEQITYEY